MTPPSRTGDEREPLRISQDTWDREPEPGRLIGLATEIGRRLIVVRHDGEEWEPEGEDPSRW
jgi:hypothetical protein